MSSHKAKFYNYTLHCTGIRFASDWRMSDLSPLAYLLERTWELDIGAFLHWKQLEDLNGSLFFSTHCKTTLLISVKTINQPSLCGTIQQSVKYEDSQHFVTRNLWTVGTGIHQNATVSFIINFMTHFMLLHEFHYELRDHSP